MRKHVNMLSATRVRQGKRYGRHHDGNGLYLMIDGHGKRWARRLTIKGRRTRVGLDPVDLKSPAESPRGCTHRQAELTVRPLVARSRTASRRNAASITRPFSVLVLPMSAPLIPKLDRRALHVFGGSPKNIRSSAGLAVFIAPSDGKAGWVAAGRAHQRFALQATSLGIRQAVLNQPTGVTSLRPQLAAHFGRDDKRPNLLVRFGRGPTLPPSLRRPVSAVIETS